MAYVVYALKSLNRNYIYVGMTSDIARRTKQHDGGKERTTKPYAPFRLIYQESVETRAEARQLEKKLKVGAGNEFLKSLL